MIKKWKLFTESNKTTREDEDSLQKYFDLTSDEVKEWIQEFLDDTMLDFDISVISHNLFMITFYEDGYQPDPKITHQNYPFPENLIKYLTIRLNEYDCRIIPEPGSRESYGKLEYVYYAISKKYMSIRVERIK